MDAYQQFLTTKRLSDTPSGFRIHDVNPALFNYQQAIVKWACRRGRAALFCDTGLGKTAMQLAWAQAVADETGGRVLILAPLAVAQQTAHVEAPKFGIEVTYDRTGEAEGAIIATNYEMLHKFDLCDFAGIVLDESSILKSYSGKVRNQIIESAQTVPYKLAATATPAPNDHMELGNHAEFLGVMTRTEMLATFFVHDGGDTSSWRLKGHAETEFWAWIATWAVMIKSPADLGYQTAGFDLPPMTMHQHAIQATNPTQGFLIPMEATSLNERRQARRESIDDRVIQAAAIANSDDDFYLVWCDLNDESAALTKAINGAVEVKGSDTAEHKEWAMTAFSSGEIRVLVTKPSICGFGMNWQHCKNVVFVGLSDSYEQFYQAIRRCYRFGQQRPVDVHVIFSDRESAVIRNIRRKEKDAQTMANNLVGLMDLSDDTELEREMDAYTTGVETGHNFTVHLGDCVDMMRSLPSDSIDYSVFSPPFASLYTYSNSDRDMGNVRNHSEFYAHYRYLVTEQFRTMKPGRLLSFHCMNLPTSKERDGYIGIADFRGDLIRMYQEAGFIYHSEVVIWKDPVVAMQRTKALGLLYKQIKKDSAMSRQGIPDYLVTMRKPGVNPDPVTKSPETFPVDLWQRYASPVWFDINPSDTLQYRSARDHKDERHICPLQLGVIDRAVELWSNPGDLVCSPFTGIGSEGYVSVKAGRRFIGAELKPSYFHQAVRNLHAAEMEMTTPTLFDMPTYEMVESE